jgi:hypothetical protein
MGAPEDDPSSESGEDYDGLRGAGACLNFPDTEHWGMQDYDGAWSSELMMA